MTKVLLSLIRCLLEALPKGENLWLFGGMNGKFYGDNSKYLAEYVNNLDTKRVYYVGDEIIKPDVLAAGLNFIDKRSIKALWILSRANAAFYTNGLDDLAFNWRIVPKNLPLIALRHGRSVKRVRFARKSFKMSEIEKQQRFKEGKQVLFATATSEWIADLQEQCLKIGRDKHVVTGYPRNDRLFCGGSTVNGTKKVLYSPSWRHGSGVTKFFPYHTASEIQVLNRVLKALDIEIHLRPHKNEMANFKNEYLPLYSGLSNVKILTHEEVPSVNDILERYTAMISDYSAIIHDFLLLNRPIVIVPYDLELFEDSIGFLYDIKKHAPGPLVRSRNDFEMALTNLHLDTHLSERTKLLHKVHNPIIKNSNERVVQEVYRRMAYRGY